MQNRDQNGSNTPHVFGVNIAPMPDRLRSSRLTRSTEKLLPGLSPTSLVCIASPYRKLFTPLLEYLDELRKERQGMIAVLLPDLVEGRWWEYLLHTQRANVLRSLLLLKGNQRVAVISVPWYLERRRGKQR